MSATVAWTALVMGLVGGSHCLAMCSAPCAAVVGAGRKPEGLTALEQPIQWTNKKPRSVQRWLRTGVFHGGAHRWVCGAGCHGGLGHGQFGLAYTANHGASALVDPDARGHSGLGFDDADPVATASLD